MKKILFLLTAILPGLLPLTCFGQSDVLGEKINENFIAAIQPGLLEQAANPETSVFDYMLVCKRLAVYGDKTAIPVLEKNLGDANKAHWARTALEAMPFPEALASLRAALGTVQDPVLKAGLINSLGMREDAEAIPLLKPLLADGNQTVLDSAAFALARIADPSYKDALLAAKDSRHFDTLLMYGDFLRRKGQDEAAESVYFQIGEKGSLDFYKEAAWYQILLRDSDKTRQLMANWLVGSDAIQYRAALRAAQFLKSDSTNEIFMNAYAKASDDRKPAILAGLGDQRNLKSQKILVEALASENETIQAAALKAMQAFASVSAFSDLVQAALSGDDALKAGVLIVVKQLPPEADIQIEKLFQSQDAATRQLAVEMAGARKMANLSGAIFDLAQKSNGAMKLAAVRALGDVIQSQDQFAFLVDLVVNTTDADLLSAAQAGLQSACGNILNRDQAAATLAQGSDKVKANKDLRLFLFQMLGTLGGPAAVDAITRAAFSDDAQSQDLATNVMGRWYDPDVAYPLIKLANTPNYKFANRALKGYLRLARQFTMPNWRRASIVRNSLASPACTDAEKEVAAIIVKQYSLDLAVLETADQKALWNFCIDSATYGVQDDPSKRIDVTRKMRDLLLQAESLTLVPGRYNETFGQDPAPGTQKKLSVTVRLFDSGETKTLTVGEGQTINLSK